MNDTFMKEKPVFPLILSMALPMVISMLVNSLYNIVDSFFVAQISENAMTALSLVFSCPKLRQCDCDWFWNWYQFTDCHLSWCRKQGDCQQSSHTRADAFCTPRSYSDDRMYSYHAGFSVSVYFRWQM